MAVLDTAIFSRTKEDARVKRGQDELNWAGIISAFSP
jgi:hypothetical protein